MSNVSDIYFYFPYNILFLYPQISTEQTSFKQLQ